MKTTARNTLIPLVASIALTACGGGDSSSGSDSVTLSGVAATGAPVANGSVTARCADASTASGPTGTHGNFSFAVKRSGLPCALAVTGGTLGAGTLGSMATAGGNVNITPLTDLALAHAVNSTVGGTLAAWLASPTGFASVAGGIPAAQGALQTALSTGGYPVPADFAPFTTVFTATTTDPYDQLLEAIRAAYEASPTANSYAGFAAAFIAGQALPVVPVDTGGGGSTDGGDAGGLATLGNRNGIALNIGNHTYVIGDAKVERFPAVNGFRDMEFGDQFNMPADTTPFAGQANVFLTSANLVVDDVAPGPQSCNDSVKLTVRAAGNISSTYRGDYVSTSCSIDVDYMSPRGAIEGTITSATVSNGTHTLALQNVPFRVYRHQGPGSSKAAIAPGARMSMYVDDGNTEFASGRQFQLDVRGNPISSADGAGIKLDDGSTDDINANVTLYVQNWYFPDTGTYNCGTRYTGLPSNKLNMQLWMGTYLSEYIFHSANPGGSCVITITQTGGGFFTGTYTATLVGDSYSSTLLTDAERTVTISGDIRNYTFLSYTATGGNEGPLGTAPNAATLTIDEAAPNFAANQTFLLGDGGSSSDWLWFIRHDEENDELFSLRGVNIPSAVGVYQCGTAYNNMVASMALYTSADLDYMSTSTSGGVTTLLPGADCSVTVDSVENGVVSGSYEATLVIRNATGITDDSTIMVSGNFRRTLPQP